MVNMIALFLWRIFSFFPGTESICCLHSDVWHDTVWHNTVWHQGLALKLLRTIPGRHLVRFIMNILSNRSFKLKTSTGQISRLCILKNGLSQGSTLLPILFNIYISDIPTTVSHQYGYTDDTSLLPQILAKS